MDVSYGITVKEVDDPYIALAEENLKGLSESTMLGNHIVDLIPPLKHLPSWFPGAGWKKEAEHYAKLSLELSNKPFDYVKEQVVGLRLCLERIDKS